LSKLGYGIAFLFLSWLSGDAVFAAQEKLANVTIAYTSISPQYAPVWIAKEAGFFKKNGINAQLVYMRAAWSPRRRW
jgi:ABC-type nitrate/sulfonate/bicarbonate transport system substrate-binding protein